jgi:hypothetical protein
MYRIPKKTFGKYVSSIQIYLSILIEIQYCVQRLYTGAGEDDMNLRFK